MENFIYLIIILSILVFFPSFYCYKKFIMGIYSIFFIICANDSFSNAYALLSYNTYFL